MILTVLRIGWLNLVRDRMALALTFAMPLVFFSVFAVVFGGMDTDRPQPVRLGLVAGDGASRLAAALENGSGIELVAPHLPGAAAAERAIADGRLDAAVVIPDPLPLGPAAGDGSLRVLVDTAHPLAARIVEGELQRAGGRLLAGSPVAGPFTVELEDVLGRQAGSPAIAYFAAGIGVMFLLFSVSGRSAILIEERETGVLARLLASRLGLTRLLIGRWLHLSLLGATQVTAMFVWGAVAFGLDLWSPRRLAGFAVMTAVTAAAAASLGLLLSATAGTRARLNGISTVVVLVMSALGGSMFPRFLMPEALREVGLLTFNAWALDGYRKVFWYDHAPLALWPQIVVLTTMGLVFFAVAVALAGRWRPGDA